MNAGQRKRVGAVPFTALIAAIALLAWGALRVALWIRTGPATAQWGNAPVIFVRGAWFDLATLAFVLAPAWLVAALVPNRWRNARPYRFLRWAAVGSLLFVLLLLCIAEFLFWNEFSTRLDFIAVDYLLYTHEVIGNIVSSYPVFLLTTGAALLAGIAAWLLSRRVVLATRTFTFPWRAALVAAAVAVPSLAYLAADVDQMAASSNAYANQLGTNGLFTFASALRRNELDFDRNYLTMPPQEAHATLRRLGVPRERLPNAEPRASALVPAALTALPARRPRNVVLITVESLSADFLGAFGNTRGLTPNLDRLAREGVLFDHLFATGTRTVRGLEALSLGSPPIPGQAIVRRPNNDHLATVGTLLKQRGYETFFMYGGYGYFDNMNTYFAGNGYDVVDRTDFPRASIPSENIWGVADEALFTNAFTPLDRASARGRPFFALVMTTSNHRPFTYPEGRIDLPQGTREGAVKYTDYAIGEFITRARSKPWFDDTLFVIVADHCAAVAGKTKLPVAKYRVPLILYAPAFLAPTVSSRVGSQIDVPPTILHALGFGSDERYFFGQSLFRGAPDRAFVSNYQELGYYKNDVLTVIAPRRRAEAYAVDPLTFEATPRAIDPTLLMEAIAYYQTAAREFRSGALKLGSRPDS